MSRILFRLLFSYVIFAIIRAVEKRFGVGGVLIMAGFVFLLPVLLRIL